MDDGPYIGNDNHGRAIKPLGVDVPRRKKGGLGISMIAVIALSSFTAFLLCVGVIWILLLKCGSTRQRENFAQTVSSSPTKLSGIQNILGMCLRNYFYFIIEILWQSSQFTLK